MKLIYKWQIGSLIPLLLTQASMAASTHSGRTSTSREHMPLKRARRPVSPASTKSAMTMRLTWQVIRSQGQGAKLSTSAETFSMDAQIIPISVDTWQLRLSGMEFPVSVQAGRRGRDGVLFIDRQDLLRGLGIRLNPVWAVADDDNAALAGIGLVLSRNQNRYLETIYRAPDEELFIVKASAYLVDPL
jgi:hypothetical protein